MTLTRTATTFAPPVMEARGWLEGVAFPPERPLINVSQAAPVDPPPHPLRQRIAEIALTDDSAHLYGPVLGLPELRAELADQIARLYGGEVAAGPGRDHLGLQPGLRRRRRRADRRGRRGDPAEPVVFQPQDVARHGRGALPCRWPPARTCCPTRTRRRR